MGKVELSSGRIVRSRVLAMLDRSDIGRKEEFWFGGLFGFRSGMIDASFHW